MDHVCKDLEENDMYFLLTRTNPNPFRTKYTPSVKYIKVPFQRFGQCVLKLKAELRFYVQHFSYSPPQARKGRELVMNQISIFDVNILAVSASGCLPLKDPVQYSTSAIHPTSTGLRTIKQHKAQVIHSAISNNRCFYLYVKLHFDA